MSEIDEQAAAPEKPAFAVSAQGGSPSRRPSTLEQRKTANVAAWTA
jgi:hypothetical protein